jgi:hypothetical protein
MGCSRNLNFELFITLTPCERNGASRNGMEWNPRARTSASAQNKKRTGLTAEIITAFKI